MKRFAIFVLLLALLLCFQSVLRAADVEQLAASHTGELLEFYKQLHANPELSYFEENTSAVLAEGLEAAGYKVTRPVGKYLKRSEYTCWGVVGVLENGSGPTVLVRGDMDALPITEKTGLPYASTERMKDISGEEVGTMHACGHDMHTTVLLGTARMLAELKDSWKGTVIIVGQTAEERGGGARALLDDGPLRALARAGLCYRRAQPTPRWKPARWAIAPAGPWPTWTCSISRFAVSVPTAPGHIRESTPWYSRPRLLTPCRLLSAAISIQLNRELSRLARSTGAPSIISFPTRSNFSLQCVPTRKE